MSADRQPRAKDPQPEPLSQKGEGRRPAPKGYGVCFSLVPHHRLGVVGGDRRSVGDAGREYTAFIGGDNFKIAQEAGHYVAEKLLPGGGEVAVLEGLPSSTPAVERLNGFKDGVKGNAKIEVVAEQAADWLPDKAQTAFAAMLQAHPNIKAVYASNDMMAAGARLAAKGAGKKDGDIAILGTDGLPGPAGGIRAVDHRNAGFHRPRDHRGQRRRLERRDQDQIDFLGDEIVHLRGLRIHVAGAVGDLQRELRDLLGRRGQFVVDVLTVGLSIVGLRKADDVIAVLAAVLDEGRGVRCADGERERSGAEHQRRWSLHHYKGRKSLPWVAHVRSKGSRLPSECDRGDAWASPRSRCCAAVKFTDPIPRGDGRGTEEPRRAR
jgi:hypothetical protein